MSQFAPKTILHGTDFSPASGLALDYAVLLARAYDARLDVMHAQFLEMPHYLVGEQWVALSQQLGDASSALEQEIREMVSQRAGDSVHTGVLVVDQHPVEGILSTVEERRPDVVVLGSHGRTGLTRLFMGSVSESVLRETSVPLLITRSPEASQALPPEVRHVLCPVDCTSGAEKALDAATSLAERLDARLTVVRVLTDGRPEAQEQTRLCDWLCERIGRRCTWETMVEHGNPPLMIVQAAARCHADLIVVGGRRRPFLSAHLFGATTEKVVRHASCPVLTVV